MIRPQIPMITIYASDMSRIGYKLALHKIYFVV